MSGTVLYDMPLYQRYINSTMNLVPGMTSGGYAYRGSSGSYHWRDSAAARSEFRRWRERQ